MNVKLSLALAFAGLVLALASVASAQPRRSNVGDALEDIEDAIDFARDDRRRCARRVPPILDDVVRALGRRATRLRIERALGDLADARDAASSCGRRVRRLLRSADRALRAALDDAVRDRRRARPRRPRRPPPRRERIIVPEKSWSEDCRTTWYMLEMMDMAGARKGDREAVARMRQLACQNDGLAELTWPSGKTARYRNGQWNYPNGKTARYPNGQLQYPSGKTAMYPNRQLQYPNGKTARYANGQWQFPNGRRAGNWLSVQSWACGASADGCKSYRVNQKSSDPTWRELIQVREAWRAGK